MRVTDILKPSCVLCDHKSTSKKRVLETLSELLADSATDGNSILDALFARERLGSTCLGHGVALPHARVPNLSGAAGAFVKLESGIDFDASDGQPVDLVFGLLVPEDAAEEHLEILSKLAELFNDRKLRDQIRATRTSNGIWELLNDNPS